MASAAHDEAQELAVQAEQAARRGDADEAKKLYSQAADLEQIAFEALPPESRRSRGFIGVSYVALLFKANRLDEAISEATSLLAENFAPYFSNQLAEVVEQARRLSNHQVSNTEDGLANLLNAATVRTVVDCLESVAAHRTVRWRPVGKRENNLATINIGSDPAAGLVERITNAVDAVLEREWDERRQPAGVRSPRQAVAEWFGISDGRLHTVTNPRADEIRELSDRVQVTLRDSDQPRAPSVDVRDYGVGLLAEEFGDSILSLNETRKLKKFFLAGAFGQGGSTALSYSEFTLIASRRHSVGVDVHPVALTLVRFNEGDIDRDKHGVYEYMVDGTTGHPFILDVDVGTFPAGTLVRHVCMDLGKFAGIMTGPTRSLWYLAHHYLFDPVIPFRIVEARDNASQGESRFVGGNYRRLETGSHTQYKRSAKLTFRTGTVLVSWWVFGFDAKPGSSESPRNFINNFTLPSKPIVITYNGQKQGELPHTIIKSDLGLPYLERFIVVHVDCDQLDNESRRQLFPTTREKLRDTTLLDQLRELVVDTLRGDEKLRVLDRERRERYLERIDDGSVEALRKRLANRIKVFTRVSSGGAAAAYASGEASTVDTRPIPIPVQDPPTFLEITTKSPKKIHPGRAFNLKFRTDAHPAYFLDPDAFIAIITPPTVGTYTGTTTVHEGYGTAYFKVAADAEPRTSASITVELRPKDAKALSSSIAIEVHPIPDGAGVGKGPVRTPSINPIFVGRNDPYWKESGWDETYVAKVEHGDSIDVYVSSENKKFSGVLVRAQRKSAGAAKAVKDFYLEHIAFHAILEDLGRQPSVTESDDSLPEEDEQKELSRACETICGVIEQLFELIATGAHEE